MIEIDGTTLTCWDIATVAAELDSVTLTEAGRRRIRDSYDWAVTVSGQRPVYGRSTGVGANRNLDVGDPDAHATALLRSHATSAGHLRSHERVRGMLTVRLNQLAAGGSGSSPAVAEALLSMLNDNALPVAVHEYGSIGTADLSALATVGLALQGETPTLVPLLQTVRFGKHDALPFISSNAGALADAAYSVVLHHRTSDAYLAVAALTFLAIGGNAEAYSPAAAAATPFEGAAAVCSRMRKLTAGHAEPRRIQDPFGVRALPQAHGPLLEEIDHLSAVTEKLANCASENPVLVPDSVAHHAGFHAAYLGQACDATGIAVAQSAQLIQARLATLIDPALTGLPPFLGDGTVGRSGVMVAEYVAASALAEIRSLATPAGLQTTVLSRGVEEDASFAAQSAIQLWNMIGPLRTMIATELVCAVRAIRMGGIRPPNPLLAAILDECAVLSADTEDRDLTADIAAAELLLPHLAALVAD